MKEEMVLIQHQPRQGIRKLSGGGCTLTIYAEEAIGLKAYVLRTSPEEFAPAYTPEVSIFPQEHDSVVIMFSYRHIATELCKTPLVIDITNRLRAFLSACERENVFVIKNTETKG